jgi:hypothetical protein
VSAGVSGSADAGRGAARHAAMARSEAACAAGDRCAVVRSRLRAAPTSPRRAATPNQVCALAGSGGLPCPSTSMMPRLFIAGAWPVMAAMV